MLVIIVEKKEGLPELNTTASSTESHLGVANMSKSGDDKKMNESQTETNIKLIKTVDNSSLTAGSGGNSSSESRRNSGRRLLEDNNSEGSLEGSSESKDDKKDDAHKATVENDPQALSDDADQSFELFRETDDLDDEYGYDYDDYVDDAMWGDEEWQEGQHEKMEDFVNIDAHILCTPVSGL